MSGGKSHHHILPLRIYFGVASALLVLTVITVAVAQFHFGAYNLLIAMAIAAVKASLVAMFFMHLKYDSKVYAVLFVGSLCFLSVFVIFTMFDTLRRGDIYEEVAHPLKEARIYEQLREADSLRAASDSLHSTEQPAEHGH